MYNINNTNNNFNYLYDMVELTKMQMTPIRMAIKATQELLENFHSPMLDNEFTRNIRAGLETAEHITKKFQKPEFGIKECKVGDALYHVIEQTPIKKTFCHLQHFIKFGLNDEMPKLLIVAPMAGHHATLLKGTVQDTLPHFDVYITEWVNANQVPLDQGSFDMDDFIDYLIEFMTFLGPNLHVMAVCQPTVPVLAATSIMSANNDPNTPKSMILMGGPVDARKNPTSVDEFAKGKSMDWFHQMVITTVPGNYPGHGRQVYPGFLQLAGFLSMNPERHINAYTDMFKNLHEENDEKAEVIAKFYDEYMSVMDLPAEFYLQTIEAVFKEFSLAKGTLVSRGRKVDPKVITKCALLGIEGEKDDIAALGQTKASLDLCSNIPDSMKRYYMQKDVGHYGVFTGSKFRKFVVPVIKDFIYKLEEDSLKK